ncbi:MAG: 3-hydroxyacyl-ACP dehydratase FabZ [Bdellovibrionaceae bacterium]|nr:3-hydroxyacyl-ACP dehydratase FabZ [Pseudobdellovibrionaceae bacterium]
MENIDVVGIMNILPHRYPFLLVDRVLSISASANGGRVGRKVKAMKNVTMNEDFFNGHFPNNPVMPGVLILEAMAQAGAIGHQLDDDPEMQFMIAGVEKAKFKKPVTPGDTLVLYSEIIAEKGKMKKLSCQAEVDGKIAAEAVLWAYATPRSES